MPGRRQPVQLDRGPGRAGERHHPRQGRAARRRAAGRGARHRSCRRGETLESVLRGERRHARPDPLHRRRARRARRKVAGLPEGQRMRILLAPGPRPGDARQIVRVDPVRRARHRGDRGDERPGRLRLGRRRRTRRWQARRRAGARGGGRGGRRAAARGSTRASTRPRSRTSCRARPSRSWSASSATTSTSSAASPPATPSSSSTASTRTTAPARRSCTPR